MVVRNGRFLRHHMAREQVTEDELMAQLRQHGYENLADVSAAYIEGDGQFSVLGKRKHPQTRAVKPRTAAGH
jgi:uncharacterized membrane protein YcaP (DUF421 family)